MSAQRGHRPKQHQSQTRKPSKALTHRCSTSVGQATWPADLVKLEFGPFGTGSSNGSAEANVGANTAAIKAFDGDERTAWLDKSAASWIQCQYVDGRKYLVTSYVLVCKDSNRLPRSVELLGSNDGGATWTSLDSQSAPGFTAQTLRREFAIAKPAKWNAYRVTVTAANENEGIQISEIELTELITCTPKLAVASVTIDQKTLSVPANGRATLSALLAPLNTWEREVTWTSSDPAVADVRRIGEQLAMVVGKKPGTCTLTASCDKTKQTCAVTITPSTLPSGWAFDELNAPPIPGAIAVTNGTFTLTGCGHAMTSWWQRVRDQGAFASKPAVGDSAITARLTSLTPSVGGPSYAWDSRPPTASGLMIRESLSEACGRHVLIQVDAVGNLLCRWRDKSGDADDGGKKDLGKVTLPIHLKLAQSGKDIQVFTSIDGKTWGEPRMTHSASFDAQARIGLFTCSGNTFAATSAAFDAVTIGK